MTTHPTARVWQISGGDLHDPVVAEAYCEEIVPRLADLPGHLGVLVVVDHERSLLRGVSFWTGEDTERLSAGFGSRAAEAVSFLASASMDGFRTYEVVVCRFRGGLGQESERGQVDGLLVRLGVLEGSAIVEDEAMARLERHVVGVIAPAPGCVGTLLLRDRQHPGVFGLSFWDDPEAARSTEARSQQLLASLGASGRTTSSGQGTYQVLVNRPMAQPVG